MNKFKKGDRVRNTGFNPELNIPKLNWEGTVDGNGDLPNCIYVCWDNHPEERDQINKQFLTLINNDMNDQDKIELTVADVKAAHAKGCSSVKQTLETMYPKVFEERLSLQGQYLHLGDREIGQVSNNGIEIYCGYQAILQGSKVIFRKK